MMSNESGLRGIVSLFRYPYGDLSVKLSTNAISFLVFVFSFFLFTLVAVKLHLQVAYFGEIVMVFFWIVSVWMSILLILSLFVVVTFPNAMANSMKLTELCSVTKESRLKWKGGLRVEKVLCLHMGGDEGLAKLGDLSEMEATKVFMKEFTRAIQILQYALEYDDWYSEVRYLEGISPKIRPYFFSKMGIQTVKHSSFMLKFTLAVTIARKKIGVKMGRFASNFKSNFRDNYKFDIPISDLGNVDLLPAYKWIEAKKKRSVD